SVSPATTTTYYVRAEGDCSTTACASLTITVKTESTDPTGITTDNDNFCPGDAANLSVQGGSLGTGANWEWFTGSCGGTSVGSGPTLNVSPATTTTYYVRAEGDCNTTACAIITITVKTESTDPTGITTDNDNFCPGDAANLSVQGGSLGDGATWEWYSGSCGGTSVGSGASINVSPAVTTTYYVRAEGDCNTTACAIITITVKTESTDPTGITTDNDNFCPGDAANLSVQGGSLGDGATWEWYSGSCGGTSVGSGPGISVSPATTTTYYVRAEGDCSTTACASLTITVKTESTDPTGITTDNDNFCPGDAANLSVQGGSLGTGANWEWYTGSCGGTSVGSGPTLNVTPAVTTTYYVRAEGDCNTTACATITITVKTESTDPTGITTDNDNFCVGESANLNVQGGSLGDGANWEWFRGSCGGTSVGSGPGISVSPVATTTYYVRAEGDCNTTACASITLTVYEAPVAYSGEDTTLCYGTPYYIQDADTTNSDGVNWEILTGNGTLDNPNIIAPTYNPDLLDGGTIVELVLHASGKGSCGEDTDTLRINYLNELTVSIGKPTPFFIDSSSTHIDVYMKITGHEYISLVGLYLVSPLDSIVELKPICTGNIPADITATSDIEYKFYNDPIDTASAGGLMPENSCGVSSGRYLFAGDWKEKLHGQDPSNGAWRVMIKDTLNYGTPGVLEEATIAFTDTNDISVLETVLYADSTINLNITGHTGSGPAAITTYTLPITGLTTSCFGLCDATAVATASGGQPPYNDIDFVWSTSIDFSVDPIFGDTVDLCAGTYYVQITDAHGCTAIDSVTVGEPAEIEITNSTVVDNVCYNDSVGEVTLEFSGGTGALTYTYDTYTGAAKVSGETFSGLKADEYTFTITDASGCTKDTSITIDEGLEITFATNVTGISCYGSADGQIEITGGLPGYLYSIDSASTWQAGNTFGPLPVDTFYVAVQDVNGCIQFGDTVELLNPDTITITSIDVTPYSCFGNEDDGEITINATGGVGVLWYSIDGTNFQIDPTFTSVDKGTYSVYVRDDCYTMTLVDTAHITGPTPITIDIVDITDVNTCYGDNTGRIEITASGGTGNFEYSNNGGADYQASNVFIGIQAGIYTLSVKDDDACVSPDSVVTVDQPVELVINGFTIIDASECNDDLTGSVTVNASGGTGALEYNVDGGAFQSDPTFTDLSTGTHTFVVRDANSCEAADDAAIVTIDPLSVELSSNAVTCFGLSNGSATATPEDGTTPYYYIWEDGETTATITNKEAGIYSVTITDSNVPTKCEFIGTVEIEEPDELQPNATPQNKKCITSPSRDLENSMGSVIVVPSGGTPGYTYEWDGPSGFDSDNDTILYLQPGNYSVTITDSRDCKTTYSTTLIEDASYDIPSYNVEFEDNTVCWNDNVIFENTFTEDAVNSIIFQISEEISPNQWVASNWEVNVSESPTVVERFINYNTNFDYIRATNEYCFQDTTDILIEYLPSFQLDIIDELDGNAEDDTIYLKGARTGMLSAYVTDTVDVSFEWYESDPIFSQEFPNAAEISIEPDSSAYYVVVATSDECVDSSRVYLEFIPAITPNEAFSPNDDGINDYWQIKFIDKFTNNKVMVFNRWGLKVFEQQRYSNEDRSRAWDGRSKNGKELPSGTYYYVIILDEAGFEPITGSITIIR
ncbi:MAG: gliding motility-associated C-terminal domain-containing protein, partial [Bacteroidetes bacterium]|nr:gliding motility-associated C-terminal domain-containing protein [Bacteroidota bacterium]